MKRELNEMCINDTLLLYHIIRYMSFTNFI
jgi:hypothetical protein